MGNDPVNNGDPDGGSISDWIRPFFQTLNLVRTPTPMAAIGQFSGVAQPTSLSGSTAAGSTAAGTSGGGSTSGGLLNSLGNAAANALGQWVANKLLPMPSGPDAKNLQAGTNNHGWVNCAIVLAESNSNEAGKGDDWVRNPNPNGVEIADLAKLSTTELLQEVRYTIELYTQNILKEIGDQMVDHFAENTGTEYSNENLENQISASSAFQESVQKSLKLVREKILEIDGNFDKYQKQNIDPPAFPKYTTDNPTYVNGLYTLIHGTQYAKIVLNRYKYNSKTKSFEGEITITIKDDFGVSSDDAVKANWIPFSKGIRCFWYLQHIKGYKPYIYNYEHNFKIKF